jgi:hypothetical protein
LLTASKNSRHSKIEGTANAGSYQNYQYGAVRNHLTTLERGVDGEGDIESVDVLQRAEPVFVNSFGAQG